MNIYIGADHAGTALKEAVKRALLTDGHTIEDMSPREPEGGDDYPDYAFLVAEAVVQHPDSFGLLVCDTGIGMAIAANKVHKATAALVTSPFGARRAREHNNAHILVLGSECTNAQEGTDIARTFLATPFSDAERHIRRIGKIQYYDTHGTRPVSAEQDAL